MLCVFMFCQLLRGFCFVNISTGTVHCVRQLTADDYTGLLTLLFLRI